MVALGLKVLRDVPQDRELINLRYITLDGRWIVSFFSPRYRAVALTPKTQLASRHEAGNDQHVHFEHKRREGRLSPLAVSVIEYNQIQAKQREG